MILDTPSHLMFSIVHCAYCERILIAMPGEYAAAVEIPGFAGRRAVMCPWCSTHGGWSFFLDAGHFTPIEDLPGIFDDEAEIVAVIAEVDLERKRRRHLVSLP